jgi:DNA-binding transcriptional LysR family regulator
MNRNLDDLDVFSDVLSIISRPTHGYVSWNGVSKRLGCHDDKIRRAVLRLEERFSTQLVSTVQGRLTPTDAGRRLHQLGQELRKFRMSSASEPTTESITVEVDEEFAPLLPRLVPEFLSSWSGQVCLKFCTLYPSKVQANIATGLTNFGIGLDGAKSSADGEVLDPRLGWRLIASETLGLSGAEPAVEVAGRFVLFLPPSERQPEGLETALRSVALSNRVECRGMEDVRLFVKAGLGVGIVPNVSFSRENGGTGGFCTFPFPELGEQQVRLYLPREAKKLSDAALSLVEAFRHELSSFGPTVSGTAATVSPGVEDSLLSASESDLPGSLVSSVP